MEDKKTMVASPFVGELGWELFTWQPVMRNHFLQSGCDRMVVYTDQPGKESIYQFADEVRVMDNVPSHESECMLWHNFNEGFKLELDALIKETLKLGKEEFGEDTQFFTYAMFQPKFNYEFYERGAPDLLRAAPNFAFEAVRIKNAPVITLCIRDRPMSDYRNWEFENWYDLANLLLADGYNVMSLGRIRDLAEWNMPVGVTDLVNKTSINDAINYMSGYCDLAVGGGTGLHHIASRCGKDHMAWGTERTQLRLCETNWFGAKQHCYVWGWDPDVDQVYEHVSHFLTQGEFKP